MIPSGADRNLLFGVLALQLDFINRDQLVAAMQAWVFDKSKPLGEILCTQKALAAENHALLEALVKKHLAQHGNDPEKSLAAVSSITDVKQDLQKIADPDVQASLGHVPAGRAKHVDPFATSAPVSSLSTASGARFRILRPHAKGGLGQVFVAHDEELHREVALKEIQERHADDPESRGRFLVEGEITGGLEHPGIVPVYGLGTYADGRPYYAMRFIRGDSLEEAIDRFHKADAAGMDPGQRTLELRALLGRLIDVCNAIEYAHNRGVLHRDLKPGNIMLGKYGETLVVDWGLAKPLGKPVQGTTPSAPGEGSLVVSSIGSASQTQMGSAIGTPQYMSPEQASGRLDLIGPASDVYSLGATLFFLLTGKPPISEKDVGVVLKKAERGEILQARALKADVPVPLEAVCQKAMALRSEDRYSSPRLLADDLEHWLADEPVSAWKEPWTVKARRWLGRHRTLVTGVSAAGLVTLIGLTAATVLLTAANERERQAREKADHNFKLAKAAVDRYFTYVSEDVLLHEPGMEPLRKKLLEAASEYYTQFTREHADDPNIEGELGKAVFRLAQITGDIGSKAEAIKLHEKAAGIFEKLKNPEVEYRSELAACYHHLGRLHRLADQPAEAETAYGKALALWQQLNQENPKSEPNQAGLARTQLGLGNVYRFRRRWEDAQKIDRQALATRQALAQAHPGVADYQRDLAVSHADLAIVLAVVGNKEKEAETAYEEALRIQKKLADDFAHITQYQDDLALTHFKLGELHAQTAQNSRALVEYKKAAEGWQGLTKSHPDVKAFHTRLASGLMALSEEYLKAKDFKNAEDACEQALTLNRQLASEDQSAPTHQADVGRSYYCLGEVYRRRGEMDKAAAAYEDAIAKVERVLPQLPQSPQYESIPARSYLRLGFLFETGMNADKACVAYSKALSWWEKLAKQYPEDQEFRLGLSVTKENLCNVHWARAITLEKMGRYADALQDWDRTLELAKDAQKAAIQLPRMIVLARTGKYEDAVKEASQLAGKATIGDSLYRFARVYSLSSASAAADAQVPDAERQKRADQLASEAVQLLTAAADKDFFKTPANLEKLRTDPDLQALRPRADFKKLCSKMESK